MAKKYTREQLEAIGMDQKQIDAILATCAEDDGENNGFARGRQQSSDEGAFGVVTPIGHANPTQQYGGCGGQQVRPVNCRDAMKITTIADLQNYASGTVVRFPDFAEGQPFVARVRRPSMLVLAKQGKIPNTLLIAAGELFTKGGGGMDADNVEMLGQVYDICKIICRAALVEPTMDDIKSAGMELSDDQLMAIFNYTQNGIKALEPFRKE